jgi:urease accessory protein
VIGPRSRIGWRLPVLIASIFLAPSAHAHSTMPGAGDVLNGTLHPFFVPAHMLLLIGLGLLIGQRSDRYLRLVFAVFVPAAAITLALTTRHWIASVPLPVLNTLALAAGAFVALDRDLPKPICGVFLLAAALAVGFDSGLEPDFPGGVGKILFGTWLGTCIGLLTISGYVSMAVETKKKWISIAVRVAGSWILAISLLMLAFALRK